MKTNLNKAMAKTRIDEISLFEKMSYLLNNSVSQCTYVNNIHGKIYVEYPSNISNTIKRVELGDLWIFIYDKAEKVLRMCIMQIKYKKRRYYRFLDLPINIYQWELLNTKPLLQNCNINIPYNILNFQKNYESISAYGIFYHDNISKRREIDFLYTLPRCLKPKNSYNTSTIQTYEFICPHGMGSPNSLCKEKNSKETFTTCSLDSFEKEVLLAHIGVPLYDEMKEFALSLLERMQAGADDASVIQRILSDFNREQNGNISSQFDHEEKNLFPQALVIATDSTKMLEHYKNNTEYL